LAGGVAGKHHLHWKTGSYFYTFDGSLFEIKPIAFEPCAASFNIKKRVIFYANGVDYFVQGKRIK
jgi:hypothetical protein